MSAKELIDGIRHAAAIPLALSRSRDVIARLIYGAPYSATLAAEHDGKLRSPTIVEERTASLASEYGPWVRQLAEVARARITGVASPFDFLSLTDLLALTRLSAQRDADGFYFQELSVASDEPPSWAERLTESLEDQLAGLNPEALIELSALVTLGREEASNYVGLLRQARANRGYGDLSAWLSAMPIHRYAAKGLAKMGQAGLELMDRQPEMNEWLVDPPPGEPVPQEEVSLEGIAQLEQVLDALAKKARLPKSLESYAREAYRALDQANDLDYFGCDELMPYLTVGYAKRQHAVICICGDLQIGKAYYYTGEVEAAAKRIAHARTFISDLGQTVSKGARIAQHATEGGEAKARKLEPLKREFMRLIEAKRPAGGWVSKGGTAAALRDLMLKANDALEGGPVLSESLESTLETWLSKDEEVKRVYSRNRRTKASS